MIIPLLGRSDGRGGSGAAAAADRAHAAPAHICCLAASAGSPSFPAGMV